MEACVDAGRYREALSIVAMVKKLNMKPDLTMTNAAIKACCFAGAMDEAEKLAQYVFFFYNCDNIIFRLPDMMCVFVARSLREYGQMDLFSYHTLMMGHTKAGGYQRVISLYEEALQSDAKLDGGVYSLAMLAAMHCKLYNMVPRIADRARLEQITLTEPSYTSLIQAYSELGSAEQSIQCLDLMVQDGLKPNEVSYSAVIVACKQRPDDVLQLLQRMDNEHVVKNTVVLTSAINVLARAGSNYTSKRPSLLSA
jgi:pentatricopeptide repeat protein